MRNIERELDELVSEIEQQQLDLSVLRQNGGAVDAIETLEAKIDYTQKKLLKLKESSRHYAVRELPGLDEQIAFMKLAQDPTACNLASEEMVQAIYQTLVGAKMVLVAELRTTIDPVLSIIESIEEPFGLERQLEFLKKLSDSERVSEDQTKLIKMYEALITSVEWCSWMAEATAERLLQLPSNKPTTDALNGKRIGSLGVYVEQDIDKSWLAYFEDWCEQPEVSGTGNSPEEATINLFKAREQKRQAVLFPEGKEMANG